MKLALPAKPQHWNKNVGNNITIQHKTATYALDTTNKEERVKMERQCSQNSNHKNQEQ